MEITVECHGVTARLAGGPQHALQVRNGASLHELLAELGARWPELGGVLPACACAVGDTVVPRTTPLVAGQRVALLPPVSGG